MQKYKVIITDYRTKQQRRADKVNKTMEVCLAALIDYATELAEYLMALTKGHIFRKSVGKDMLDGKYGKKASAIPIISKQLRHSKPSTTMDHYLKADIEAVKEAW